jgi:hypothetical protein
MNFLLTKLPFYEGFANKREIATLLTASKRSFV